MQIFILFFVLLQVEKLKAVRLLNGSIVLALNDSNLSIKQSDNLAIKQFKQFK